MNRKLSALTILLFAAALPLAVSNLSAPNSTVQAQPTPEKTVATGTIRFPLLPVQPEPIPPPQPLATTPRLPLDTLYVIDADIPVIVLDSPLGLVKVTEEAGPVKIRGRFVDGTKVETKTFRGKQVFIVEAVKTGSVEILVVPVGATANKDVLRKMIDVDAGEGPRPPPGPGPGPNPPTPNDPFFPLDGKTRVLIVYETADGGKLTAGQQAAIRGQQSRAWMDSHCTKEDSTPAYRIWDKDVNTTNAPAHWQKALQKSLASGIALPMIVVSNGRDLQFVGPLPTDDVMPVLKKVGGE